ncbi:hypothetical protein HZH66_000385 [Vespula vulgaris]|uniref:Folded gastrulation N-terminal domain-containing protein n=1 Tax=Vespula vulgaris TaxID=7454 RepID=A0A834KP04_VESVU|nr:hypothetical protein HZH66_000385 [Vespula vulgaris]
MPTSRKGSRGSSSPSELTWEAWLLVDAQAGDHAGLDSANILRKITPKSIFFAPTRIECAEGYRADTMDRCVKDVKIDHEAQFDFLLKRVSAMYLQRFGANTQDQKTKDQKHSSGPLQLSIPLLGAPIAASPVETQQITKNEDEGTNEPPKETVTVYEAKNETTTEEEEVEGEEEEVEVEQEEESKEEDKKIIFLGNTSSNTFVDKNDSPNESLKSEGIVPVAEFVDETNGSSFSEIVDYKIPIDLKNILNVTNAKKKSNGSEIVEDPRMKEIFSMNVTSMSPTLVFVLTPTKQPQTESSASSENPPDDPPEDSSNVTTDLVIVRMTESMKNSSNQEIDVGSESNSMVPPLRQFSEIPLIIEDKIENNGSSSEASGMKINDGEEQETTYEDEPVEEDIDEDDDEYVDNTDTPEEEFTELEGEILKHGEAGITIPVKNLDRLHLEEEHRERTEESVVKKKNENDTFDSSRDEISIRFNHTIFNMDEPDSNISSEATIKDDVIIETTLLNVDPMKLSNDSKSPFRNDSSENDEDERFNEHFESEKTQDARSKILFPKGKVRTTISTSTEENGKLEDQVSKTRSDEKEKNPTDLRNVELVAEPSSSESLLYDPRSGDRYTGESIVELGDSKKTTTNRPNTRNLLDLEGSSSFVRSAQSYVKFPSDEINSIHNQDYKERGQHLYDEGLYASTSTKSSVPVHQKSSYPRTPTGWRIDRQQQPDHERNRSVVVQRQKPRQPMYLSRTKAPLTRNSPSLYSISQPPRSATIMDRGYRNTYVQVSPFHRVGY